jgi:ATP-binding cassette subfamily B protein
VQSLTSDKKSDVFLFQKSFPNSKGGVKMKSKKVHTKATVKFFWRHATHYKAFAGIFVFASIAVACLDVLRPVLLRGFVDSLIGNDEFWTLIYVAGIIIGHLFGETGWRTMAVVNSLWMPRVKSDLLNTCYEYLQRHSYSYFTRNHAGGLVTKIRRYAECYGSVDDKIKWTLWRIIILCTVVQIALFFKMTRFAWITLAWFFVYTAFAVLFARLKRSRDLAVANQETLVNAHLSDTISNHITVSQFSNQTYELTRFQALTAELARLRVEAAIFGQKGEILQSVAVVLLDAAMLLYAAFAALRQEITVGDVVMLSDYVGQLSNNLWDLGKSIAGVHSELATADETTEMIVTNHEVVDRADAPDLVVPKGEIRFEQVTFQYGVQKQVLSTFDLTIKPGERIALVGPSGAGKSSIVNVLVRFLDIQGGRILIDNQNIRDVNQYSLRRSIAVVPQDASLFHRTLFDNIAYGKPQATPSEVEAAAHAAYCHDLIMAQPDGYQTMVGDRGLKLSGGQRQRILIARAYLTGAPVLVFDEATSSLDSESEMYIQEALFNLMKNRTTIVIAHRLSTIQMMDRIIVIQDGQIVEEGKHEDLMAKEGGFAGRRVYDDRFPGYSPVTTYVPRKSNLMRDICYLDHKTLYYPYVYYYWAGRTWRWLWEGLGFPHCEYRSQAVCTATTATETWDLCRLRVCGRETIYCRDRNRTEG